jgi:hypothetical protein
MRREERDENKGRKGARSCKFYKRKKNARVNFMWPAKTKVMRAREHRRREQRRETDGPLVS